MNSETFIAWIQRNAARITHYQNGGDGSGGGCDCIGLIIGAWRLSGNRWPWTHGSNYAARYLTRGLAADQPLRLGDLVYKAREPGASAYALPATYRGHHDRLDYYHVGVVTCADPLQITHCTSVNGGIKRDTRRGSWRYSGQFIKLSKEEMPMNAQQMTVTANQVNLRAGPDKASARVEWLSKGDIVTALPFDNLPTDWAYVQHGAKQGYVMARYLQAAEDAPEAPAAPAMPTAMNEAAAWLQKALAANEEEHDALVEMQKLITGAVG